MARISVLYPSKPGKRLHHDRDVTKHMRLVPDRLGSFGVVGTEVDTDVAGGAPRSSAPHVANGHLDTDALDRFQKGVGPHGKAINIQPPMQISEIVG
jgi:hypothetical protein